MNESRSSLNKRPQEEHPADLPDPTRRMVLMLTGAIASAGVIGYRLYDWHVTKATQLSKGTSAFLTRHEIDPRRGSILDRTGDVLAISRGTTRVIADPQKTNEETKGIKKASIFTVAQQLADLLNLDAGTIVEKLGNPEARYAEIAREVLDEPAGRIQRAINSKDEETKLYGIRLEADKKRVYPNQELAAHVLGFVGESAARPNDVVGQAGIEAYYDDHLGGQPGLVSSDIDKEGRRIPIGRHSMQQPRHGSDVTLAIDRTIQHIIEQELTNALKKYGAAAGSIVVTNPTTGEVLGLANRPTFDPGLIHQYPLGPELNNRVTGRMYEPGSTFKLITMAAALNENIITPDSTHNNPGEMEYGGQEFKNWDQKTYPNQTMIGVLQHSSNTGSIFVADKIGEQKFYQYVNRFGFGEPTGVEGVGEESGIIRGYGDPNWYRPDLASNSFGQGIMVTPIQMAAAIGAIANDGILMTPRIASTITHADGRREPLDPSAVRRVIRKETAQTLVQMMEAAEQRVGVNLARIPGYRTAGKTGTAQIAEQGQYRDQDVIASYVGFGPLERPQVLALVIIEKPEKESYGALVASPTFAEIMRPIFSYLKIPQRDPTT